jgi:hypothetical protein
MHLGSGVDAALINVGTIDAFLWSSGNLLMTATNGVSIMNWLQALAGTITVDTKSIAEIDGRSLFDGIFEAKDPDSVIRLGGSLRNLIVNIKTLVGPPTIPTGWTELILNDPTGKIEEWEGAKYVARRLKVATLQRGANR